ncbi:MAG: molecular chaperone HtpG [Defluviitaleaceae bacterium]|nr:molecular chaperone HtpG [Defluviitaleaceae bacterium]
MEKGNLSIHSENILPIIKKWLYADMDIFARELVSNGVDAITKLKKLVEFGEAPHILPDEKYAVHVIVDKENKLLHFQDNGIGMTEDEIKEYINQIAFSGANAFMEKYKDVKDGEFIGHFGLGFYSAFMVADKVEIHTLSYREGAAPMRWSCDGGIEYEMQPGDRTDRGTCITLHVNEDGEDFLQEYKLREVLQKYCGFVPVEIYVEAVNTDEPVDDEADDDNGDDVIDVDADGAEDKNSDDATDAPAEEKKPEPINDIAPLWLKKAQDCTDDEYKTFYRKMFSDFNDPLFWIHLNMDFPFRLKGILFFPKMKHDLEYIEGTVKLFNNQVYVADNIKEVIPEYLLLLKGVMDCPDLPLNVSRSFLQNDANVKKMSGYISRKVADKLNSLFKRDRDVFNGYWDDIAPFIKYGCIKEKDFYDKIKGSALYKTTDGTHKTMAELTEGKDKPAKVFYVTDAQVQSQYVRLFKEQGLEAILLTTNLDVPFISYLETYEPDVKFNRIDSDLTDALKDDATEGEETTHEGLQTKLRELLGDEKLKVEVQTLKSSGVSSVMLLSEQSRRMKEMSKMFGGMDMPGMFAEELTLVLNKNHGLVQTLLAMQDQPDRAEDAALIAQHLHDLALLSHKPLEDDKMTAFIERSNRLLEMVAGR